VCVYIRHLSHAQVKKLPVFHGSDRHIGDRDHGTLSNQSDVKDRFNCGLIHARERLSGVCGLHLCCSDVTENKTDDKDKESYKFDPKRKTK